MLSSVTDALLAWARVVPLETFAVEGSFIEEVLAPVPSPIVMTVTGSIAAAQDRPMSALMMLSLIAALGKTAGAVIVYGVAAKAEHLIFGRFGWMFGASHDEIVTFGKKMRGTWRDHALLFFLRALPVMSSAVVSVGAGAVKVPMRVYLPMTFLGTVVRDAFYLYVGYTGVDALYRLVQSFEDIEAIIELMLAAAVVVVLGWIALSRRKQPKKQAEDIVA